jgi:16S rRNA (guanine527-N7)-methyltransferase
MPWDLLVPHLLRARTDPEVAIERLKAYTTRVLDWNANVSNLISRHDETRFVERHLLESLEPAHWILESGAENWIDFGSGAGLPALPLALAGIGKRWVLVESRRPKTLFLRKTLEDLQLKNIEIVHSRLEILVDDPEFASRFDGFTSRATLTLVPTLLLAAKVVARNGTALLWKGSRREEEMNEDDSWKTSWEHNGLLGLGSGNIAVAKFLRL